MERQPRLLRDLKDAKKLCLTSNSQALWKSFHSTVTKNHEKLLTQTQSSRMFVNKQDKK